MLKLPYAAGLAVPIAVLTAFAGPAFTGPRNRSAGEPFAYAMPEGFSRADSPGDRGASERNTWVHAPLGDGGIVPNVSITHVSDMEPFDAAKLASIAAGMPAYFEGSGVQWREVRHAQLRRRDGALVGLLEGENTLGEERFRSLQLSFPDDRGASLVTANFPSPEASHWEPVFEAPIEASRGVATRGIQKPLWVTFAWGGGGAAVSLLLLSVLGSRPRRPAVPT